MTANPPRVRRPFTAAEFWQMVDLGFFRDQRVELIGGEVVPVASQSNWHSFVIEMMTRELRRVFPEADYWVRAQFSLSASSYSVVDPDVAVIPGGVDGHRRRQVPTTAVLVVEVSETTVADDRNRKASLYAAAGIADYWVVDVTRRRIEVRRDPRPDAAAEFGAAYATVTVHADGLVVPLAAPAGGGVHIATVLAIEEDES